MLRFAFFLIAALGCIGIYAQPINNYVKDVVMPSPTASSFGKFGEIPVSYHTGVPNISVPIYTATSGSLSTSIALSYNSSGIKPGEIASWVGAGWTLDVGAHISRSVVNVEDENTGRKGYYHQGINLPSQTALTGPQVIEAASGQMDSEPDIFSYNIPGYSGKFLFDKNKNPFFVPRQDLKIETDGNFNQFVIIDPNGIRYIFGQNGAITAYEVSKAGNAPSRTGWFLLKIESPDKLFNITFEYITEEYGYKQLSSCTFSTSTTDLIGCGSTSESCSGPNLVGDTRFSFVHTSSKRLTKITTNNEIINFNASIARQDLDAYELNTGIPIAKRLEEIEITSNPASTAFCNKWKFAYDYFDDSGSPQCQAGGAFTNAHCKKLKLLSLTQEACTAGQIVTRPYSFTYNGNIIANCLTKRVDHWGFHNGASVNDNNNVLAPTETVQTTPPSNNTYPWTTDVNRETDETNMKMGIMTKMTYPTGGTTEFDYEANRVVGPNAVTYQSLLPSNLTNCSYAYNNPDCCNASTNSPSTNYTFLSASDITNGFFKLTFDNANCQSLPSSPYGTWTVAVEVRQTGNTQILGYYSFNVAVNGSGQTAYVPINTLYAGFVAGTQYNFKMWVSGGKGQFILFKAVTNPTTMLVGGLRIKSIKNSDGVNTVNDIIRTYEYTDATNSSLPSGKLLYKPVYGQGVLEYTPAAVIAPFYTLYFQIASNAVVPLYSMNGYHISYERVIENFNGNGKNIYTFLIETPPVPYPEIPMAPVKALIYAGAPLTTTSYAATNAVVQSSTTTYNGSQDAYYDMQPNMFSARLFYICTPQGSPGGSSGLELKKTTYYTHRSRIAPRPLTITSVVDGITTVKNIGYDPTSRFLAPTAEWTINSDGKQTRSENKYVHDLSAGSIRQYLLDRNMIAEPYEVNTYVGGSNGTGGTQTNGMRKTFASFNSTGAFVSTTACAAADHVRPYQFSSFEMTYIGSSPSSFGFDLRGTINSYNALGLPTSYTAANWLPETYTWSSSGLALTKTYNGYVTEYSYLAGTRILTKMKQPDGQEAWYDYDQLGRLTKAWARPTTANTKTSANIVTDYEYRYKGQTTPLNSKGENYIKTTTTFATAPTGGGTSSLVNRESIQFVDGLGRGYQTVNTKQSPAQKDVVMVVEYDKWGRAIKNYNPIESANNTGDKLSSIPSGTPFSLTEYYSDPLNRQWKSTPPSWYATTMAYSTNIANEVKLDHTANTFYAAGELSKTTVTDPDNKVVVTYKDKKGRTLLVRRTDTANSGPADTYYIYDDKDRQIKVIPPGSTFSSTTLNFDYTYDQSDNMLTKKVPDAAQVSMKYNTRDQLALAQDGNQLALSKWMCTQYDDFGRVIKSGLFSGTVPASIPTTLAPTDLYTEAQYGTSGIQLGKIVKNKAKAFDAGGTWLETNMTYDSYGRLSGTTANNYLLPTDLNAEATTMLYDFADNVLKDTRVSKKTASVSNTLTQTHNYDHWGRNTLNTHQVGSGTVQTISQLNYNWKDQLIERNIGKTPTATNYLQSLDYAYNDLGWMTSINGPSLGGTAISFPACPTVQDMPNPGAANATPDLNDLFSLELKYDALQANIPGTTNKNGNISQVIWKVRGRERQAYSLTYDYLNRMTAARYDNLNDAGTAVNNTNAWNENLTYDIRGNINTLTRTGKYKTTPSATCWTDGQIDNLAYTYNANTNRLQKIADTAPIASIAQGWNNTAGAASTAQYGYDANGNMTTDPYKGMSITYNFMNLPTRFTFTGNKIIDVIYDGGGRKLRKTVTDNGTVQYVQNYVGGIEYRTNSTVSLSLESVYHGEGRVFNTNTGTTSADALRYEYAIRDHLGNTRLMFSDKNADGKIDITTTASTEVLQENHYYPFGMNMSGSWQDDAAARNYPYQYNGKELNEDFGLGWNDYGARWYDASLGRFSTIDRFGEKYTSLNGYQYGANNPMLYVDINGDSIWIAHGLFGQKQSLYHDGKVFNKDGSEYTKKQRGFLKQTVKALDKIDDTEEGRKIVQSLSNSTCNVTIVRGNNSTSLDNQQDARNGQGSGSKISWSPINNQGAIDENGRTKRPSFIGLAHELAHAFTADNGNGNYKSMGYPSLPRVKMDEYTAVHYENIIRAESGLPLRVYYGIDNGNGVERMIIPGGSQSTLTNYDYSIHKCQK